MTAGCKILFFFGGGWGGEAEKAYDVLLLNYAFSFIMFLFGHSHHAKCILPYILVFSRFRSCTSSVSDEDRLWGVKKNFSWWFQIGLHSTLVDRRESNFTNMDERSVQRERYKRKRKCSSSSCYESASLRNEAKAESDLPIVQLLSYLCNISYNSKTIMHEATFRWNSTWIITQKRSLAEIFFLSVWYLVCFLLNNIKKHRSSDNEEKSSLCIRVHEK